MKQRYWFKPIQLTFYVKFDIFYVLQPDYCLQSFMKNVIESSLCLYLKKTLIQLFITKKNKNNNVVYI